MGQAVRSPSSPPGTKAGEVENSARPADLVFSLVYEELRSLASAIRRRSSSAELNSTALVNEAWLKLKNSRYLADLAPGQFKAVAARAMRQVLVDAARKRNSGKGGAAYVFVTLDESAAGAIRTSGEVLALHEALDRLAAVNPRQAAMVEMRFFTGLTAEETAEGLGVSLSAVERDWRAVKAWLAVEMRKGGE